MTDDEGVVERFVGRAVKLVLSLVQLLMAAVVVLAAVDLAWNLVRALVTPPFGLVSADALLELFGLFLLVLVGVELLETIARKHGGGPLEHASLVLIAALIATARSIVVLKDERQEPGRLLGFAALTLALAAAIALLRARRRIPRADAAPGPEEQRASEPPGRERV